MLVRLESQPGDPKGWVRVEAPMRVKMSEPETYGATPKMIAKFGYEEGEGANPKRIRHLGWIIGGKRTVVEEGDVLLLERFLKGKIYFDEGKRGPSVSMKSRMPRLHQLLRDIPESKPTVEKPVKQEKSRKSAFEIGEKFEVDMEI